MTSTLVSDERLAELAKRFDNVMVAPSITIERQRELASLLHELIECRKVIIR